MSDRSRIEWTDATWNPVTGCTAVSPGCAHCYARRMALRLQAMGKAAYARGFEVTEHPSAVVVPLGWRASRRVFVCSMGDLFHPQVTDEFVHRVFDTIARASQHTFQVLTKRPARAARMAPGLPWPPNLWLGTTVESSEQLSRMELLCKCAARVLFVSLEPLLGPVDLGRWVGTRAGQPRADGRRLLDWVIVGGETGPGAREMKYPWAAAIRDRCAAAGVPFFFKRWGGTGPNAAARTLDGRRWEQMP